MARKLSPFPRCNGQPAVVPERVKLLESWQNKQYLVLYAAQCYGPIILYLCKGGPRCMLKPPKVHATAFDCSAN